MIAKPLADISWADIEVLVADERPEGQTLEFKRELPRKNPTDPVVNALTDWGKERLLDEIVAFANADGGDLIIGIDETADHPKRATAILPLPDAADTAHRLENVIRDKTDPKLARCDVQAVLDASGNAGVIVVRVPRSADAPHRNLYNKEIRVRRGEHSMPMQMREVHDLVRLRDRGIAAIENMLRERQAWFEKALEPLAAARGLLALRISAVPLVPMNIDRIHERQGLRNMPRQFHGRLGGGYNIPCLNFVGREHNWRPGLRRTISAGASSGGSFRTELGEDGSLEAHYIFFKDKPREAHVRVYVGWYVGTLVGALNTIAALRSAAGRPEAEYVLQAQWWLNDTFVLCGYSEGMAGEIGEIFPGSHLLPLYPIGSRETFNSVVEMFERDLFNIAGGTTSHPITFDFETT